MRAMAEVIPDSMVERGIDCPKTPVECGLGKMACTMYRAVWFGGKCEQEDCAVDFAQGNFVGNLEGITKYEDGVYGVPSGRDSGITDIIATGFTIKPV